MLKVNSDADFITLVKTYDIITLCETWNSKCSYVTIPGYDFLNCPRPKFNQRAKRDSGGIIVYYKSYLKDYLSLESIDHRGIIWFKLRKEFTNTSSDVYFCNCYIPPADSRLYRNPRSPMLEFDFFEHLNNDIRKYTELGLIFMVGDFNSRTGELHDYVPDLQLDRYID